MTSGTSTDFETENKKELHLALEVKTTTQSMAINNFISALKMKNPDVEMAHVEMALQQFQLLMGVTEFIEENGAGVTPFSNAEEQHKVLEHFIPMLTVSQIQS